MNLRVARKIVRRAGRPPYTVGQAHRALRRVHGWLYGLMVPREDGCPDCPMPSPDCRNGARCDLEARAFSLAMALDMGRHPWGPWRCLMQRAADAP